jgi:hypothetical protein
MPTERSAVSVESANVALTLWLSERSAVHEIPAPEHEPPQPLKTLPGSGVSTTVRTEPEGTLHEQLEPESPQSISLWPPPETVPLPAKLTESVRVVAGGPENVAVISWSSLSEITQSPVSPSQSPGPPAERS